MKKVIKSLLITLLALIAACAVALAVLWQSYTPPDPLETTAADQISRKLRSRSGAQGETVAAPARFSSVLGSRCDQNRILSVNST